ncbi:MAG: hypothetical protein WBQ78_02845 [Gammaproteobacteria bacterium]
MNRLAYVALVVLFFVLPGVAAAAGWEALAYFGVFQGLSRIWPFVLPLFFLRRAPCKLQLYLVLLLLPLGVLEVIDTLWFVVTDLSSWGVFEYPRQWLSTYAIGRHLVAICVSIWIMPRFSRFMRLGIESRTSAQQHAAADRTASPPDS